MEVLLMTKNNKQNKKQQTVQSDAEKKTGYGDKKLIGENRPAE
jgi:hypothetical protein